MRILLVGAGAVGSAAREALTARGHEVIAAHRSSVDHPIDVTDPDSIQTVLDTVGSLDAVVSTAGTTPYAPWDDLDRDAWMTGINSKLLGPGRTRPSGHRRRSRGWFVHPDHRHPGPRAHPHRQCGGRNQRSARSVGRRQRG